MCETEREAEIPYFYASPGVGVAWHSSKPVSEYTSELLDIRKNICLQIPVTSMSDRDQSFRGGTDHSCRGSMVWLLREKGS